MFYGRSKGAVMPELGPHMAEFSRLKVGINIYVYVYPISKSKAILHCCTKQLSFCASKQFGIGARLRAFFLDDFPSNFLSVGCRESISCFTDGESVGTSVGGADPSIRKSVGN